MRTSAERIEPKVEGSREREGQSCVKGPWKGWAVIGEDCG